MSDVFLSKGAHGVLQKYLAARGHRIIRIGSLASVDDAVSSHPDIYLCRIRHEIVMAPALYALLSRVAGSPWATGGPGSASGPGSAGGQETGTGFSECNIENRARVIGSASPSGAYPSDIPYNAACFGRFFMHNLKYTDPVLLRKASDAGLSLIQVNQGYTKCNTVIVDGNGIITSDHGIAAAAASNGIEVLVATPGHVRLEGHPYGFLGGAAGRIGDQVIFNGDLSRHPDFKRILDFISQRGLATIYFEEYPLEDIGSIIEIEVENL